MKQKGYPKYHLFYDKDKKTTGILIFTRKPLINEKKDNRKKEKLSTSGS
jgi:hypothetical protein